MPIVLFILSTLLFSAHAFGPDAPLCQEEISDYLEQDFKKLLHSFTDPVEKIIVHERKLQEKIFPSSDKCHLQKFSVFTKDEEVINQFNSIGNARSTALSAMWETSAPECSTQYGVVQYIKGCVYQMYYDPKTGTKEYNVKARKSRGKSIDFKHHDWEVDSTDVDPLYGSDDSEPDTEKRFYPMRVPSTTMSLKQDSKELAKWDKHFFDKSGYSYIGEKPEVSTKRMFVTDFPTGSDYSPPGFVDKEGISVSSLKFKTCIYEIKNIPKKDDPASFEKSPEEGGPLTCFDWSQNFKPNFENKNFEHTEEFDPYCEVK